MALNVWTKLSGYEFLYHYTDGLGVPQTTTEFPERTAIDETLPVLFPLDTNIEYTVITGKLPAGLRLQQTDGTLPAKITGTLFEVPRVTQSTFCIRATNKTTKEISDRTYKMSVGGADAPEFVTTEGTLAVGEYQQLYTLERSYIDYQIEAFDADLSAGQSLTYYLVSGQLPDGLTLGRDGKITGFINPSKPINPADGAGIYDDGFYDAVFYDYGVPSVDSTGTVLRPKTLNRNYEFVVGVTDGDVIPYNQVKATGAAIYVTGSVKGSTLTITNGTDIVAGMTVVINGNSFIEGTTIMPFGSNNTTGTGGTGTYRLSAPQPVDIPSSTFILSDIKYTTEYHSQRKFAIYVVGDDYFRADNTTWLDGTGFFTADVTYLRAPVWITQPNLGTYRANNYITIDLQTYDSEMIAYDIEYGKVGWTAATSYAVNDLILVWQDAVWYSTTTYDIGTIVSHNGSRWIALTININQEPDGTSIHWDAFVPDALNSKTYICITAHTSGAEIDFTKFAEYGLPPGMSFDKQAGAIYGSVPYQPAISKIYRFIGIATRYGTNYDSVSTKRTFYLNLIGEVDSVITWNTNSNLGTLNANYVSLLSLSATSTVPGAVLLYNVVGGTLPPGLSLNSDGELVGKVRQFGDDILYRSIWRANRQYNVSDVVQYNDLFYKAVVQSTRASFNSSDWVEYFFTENRGITVIDGGDFVYDGGLTVFDNIFTFTVQVRDQYGYSASERLFTITVDTPNTLVFSNIKTRPFLKMSQRDLWTDFINNTNIFTPSSIYRPNDSNFGLQTELSMLVYAGIETSAAADYISAIGLNHKRKRFQFGDVKSAIAYEPGTNNAIYEVVYVEMIDPMEPNGKRLPSKINAHSFSPNTVTVDNSGLIWSEGFSVNKNPNPDGVRAPTTNQQEKINALEAEYLDLQRPDQLITADRTGYVVSTPNQFEYYVSSISNWRNNIKGAKQWAYNSQTGAYTEVKQLGSERNYLPLWMRSIQPGSKQELDFQLAVPLCYCKVGTSADILLNIKNSKFNFNVLDYTADRYIIDSTEGSTSDKYLIFRNDRITI